MEELERKKKLIDVLFIAEIVVTIITVIAYIFYFLQYVGGMMILYPFLILGVVKWRKEEKKQLLRLAEEKIEDLNLEREHNRINEVTYRQQIQEIRMLIYDIS